MFRIHLLKLKLHFILNITLAFLFTLSFCKNIIADQGNTNQQNDTVSISVVGDLMCHSPQFNYARVEKDSFDFNPVYREVKKYFGESDFLFGNLETVTAGNKKKYSGYPFFNTPYEFITALANAGFDLLSTANNHALDQGEAGVQRTIQQLKKNGIAYNGTFLSQEDRDSIRVFNIKGIRIAFLAYTFGTNGIAIPKGKSYLVNLIDYGKIRDDIISAKAKKVDLVLVHFHFGTEYKREPTLYQKDVVDSTIKFGADIIIGGHPHVIEPIDYIKSNSSDFDSVFVEYSMGNFISNQRWRYSDAGLILNLNIVKDWNKDTVYLSEVNYIPTWVFKGETENGNEYIILPSEIAFSDFIPDYLSSKDIELMKESFNDTKNILTKYSNLIKLKSINKNRIPIFFHSVDIIH